MMSRMATAWASWAEWTGCGSAGQSIASKRRDGRRVMSQIPPLNTLTLLMLAAPPNSEVAEEVYNWLLLAVSTPQQTLHQLLVTKLINNVRYCKSLP